MLIFYQIRTRVARTVFLHDIPCPECGYKGGLKMYVLQKYTWLFGPILPAGKTAHTECKSCEKDIPVSSYTKEMHQTFLQERKATPIPFRFYRGFIFLILLFLIPFILVKMGVSFQSKTHQKIVNAKIEQELIKTGDLLYVSLMENGRIENFTVVKVKKTQGNKIAYIIKSNKTYSNFNDDLDLKASDFSDDDFQSEPIKISLTSLHDYGAITPFDDDNEPSVAIMAYHSIIK